MSDPIALRALLVVDIGSAMTHIWLVDAVDGETRLIGYAEAPSSITFAGDATHAILEATRRIEEQTGRRLLSNDTLITPKNAEGDGVDGVLACTSAAGIMSLIIAAVAGDISARSAQRAARTTYTRVLQTITLDDAARQDQIGVMADSGATWIERQVQALLGVPADGVLLVGGIEGGAYEALVRLAHIVRLALWSVQANLQDQQARGPNRRPVIFAGNSQVRDSVVAALADYADLVLVDNIRPTLDVEQLDPVRREIVRIYGERIVTRFARTSGLQRLTRAPIQTSCNAAGVMTRFLAEAAQCNVLTLDVGSLSATAHLCSQGRYSPVVLGGVGSGYGIGAVLVQRGVDAIRRWLPFPISERDLVHWLLNKMLRPHIPPLTREELLIEHAVAREALSCVLEALLDERPDAQYDRVLVSGGVLRHAPHPGLALLTVLDALQPTSRDNVMALDVHLDSLGLMNACGTLAFFEADAALTLFERDLMNNTPLATVVTTLGEGRMGEVAVEAELRVEGGATQTARVAHGEIARLSLPPGRYGTLTLRPSVGVQIGRNAPGAEVASELAAIRGSALGVVIDARGRPLRLPDEPQTRQQALWSWLMALGIEREPLPYPALDSVEEAPAPVLLSAVSEPRGSQASLPRSTERQTMEAAAAGNIEDDLAKLRQTVEAPQKKRSFFRRK
ncbi:MAG: glutamate mutase L [Roseiflexus sp.]|nr:glutamate mutase L [Roseiflexus sp.]MCS7289541.1 glutamate mutase L [Roseiflexus sp.]MDW8148671.1 glutamate mutase L [Roseiflexaceae bacterium]MDW8233104.1 glutamate mutase L [Roseiflexaceae bacterium]